MGIQDEHNHSTWILTVFSAYNSINFQAVTAESVTALFKVAGLGLGVHSLAVTQSNYHVKRFVCEGAEVIPRTVLNEALIQQSEVDGLDYVLLQRTEMERPYKLAVFDMDSTLIDAEVIVELAKQMGIGNEVNAITESAMRGEIDFQESFHQRLSLLKGLPVSVLQGIADNIVLNPGVERLLASLKAQNCRTAIASGGFSYFAEYFQRKLDIDSVYSNPLGIESGKLTGQVVGPIVDGAAKAERVKALALQHDIPLERVAVFGDGANDLPMMEVAGMSVAFRAKPLVRLAAKASLRQCGLDAAIDFIDCLSII